LIALCFAPLDPAEETRLARQKMQRRQRLLRFAMWEAVAFAIFFISATVGIRERHGPPPSKQIFDAFTIFAAVAVAIIPVIFYGPTHPQ
jgi:hypothetical protein